MALFITLLMTKETGPEKHHDLVAHLATSSSVRGNPKLEAKPQCSAPNSSFMAV